MGAPCDPADLMMDTGDGEVNPYESIRYLLNGILRRCYSFGCDTRRNLGRVVGCVFSEAADVPSRTFGDDHSLSAVDAAEGLLRIKRGTYLYLFHSSAMPDFCYCSCARYSLGLKPKDSLKSAENRPGFE